MRRPGRWWVLLCTALVFVVAPAWPQTAPEAQPSPPASEEDLFQRAFGASAKTAKAEPEIALPLWVSGRPRGSVKGTFPKVGGTRIRAAELADRLVELVRPERLEVLRNAAAATPLLTLPEVVELGFALELDAAKLELFLDLDAADRLLVDLPLRQQGPPPLGGEPLLPAPWSGFVNVRLASDLARGEAPSSRLQLEPAIDFGKAVFEGAFTYADDERSTWRRGDMRLVRDRPDRQQRFTAGDLAYPVTTFQTFRPMAGLALARDFSLDPYRVVQPLGDSEFLLPVASRLEVKVNGRSERTFRLPAGRYRIHDFFLESGWNDVELLITDDSGREQRIDLGLPFDHDLLRPGLSRYALAVGVEAEDGERGWRYLGDRPMLSGLYELGLSATATGGIGLQADRDGAVATTSGLLALRWGSVALQAALARHREDGSGGAFRLALERHLAGARNPRGRRLGATLTWRSPGFKAWGDEQAVARRADLLLRWSQRLGKGLSLGLALEGEYLPASEGLLGGVALSLRRAVGRRLHLSADVSWRQQTRQRDETRLAFSWSWALPDRRQQLHGSLDTVQESSRLDWSFSPLESVGSWNAAAAASHGPGGTRGDVDLRFAGQRGESRFRIGADSAGERTASFHSAWSVVVVGNRLAIGRPVSGAFALLAPHPTLAGATVGADRGRDHFSVLALPAGGVVPNLAPYLARTLAVEVLDLPPGFDPGPGLFRLLPRYKSGTLVPVGTGATVALSGRLVTAGGSPLALVAGRVIESASPGEPPIFFTNRAGRFRVEGLHPGRLELVLGDGRAVVVEIGPERQGVVELGNLTVADEPPAKSAGEEPR